VIVLEAAVLIEAGWQDLVDEVWVLHVAPEVAKKRLMGRNNLSAEQAQARIDSQITNEERLGHADVSIENAGKLDAFVASVDAEWERLQRRIKAAGRKRAAGGRKR
jgi:dephospho-CoA kinase